MSNGRERYVSSVTPGFRRQGREFVFFSIFTWESSKLAPILDRGTGTKPEGSDPTANEFLIFDRGTEANS